MNTKPHSLGARKCMADGGLVGSIKSLFSSGPAETVTQKYARQDAERAAKEKPAATPTAPAPAPQVSAISDYAGMGAMQRREAAAGLKNGGAVKPRMIHGPGTGTSDSIPRDMRPGSYVMPADSTKHLGGKVPVKVSNGESQYSPEQVHAIGAKVLDMVKAATHKKAGASHPDVESKREDAGEPAGAEMREMKGMGARMKNGGCVKKMADGGVVTPQPTPAPQFPAFPATAGINQLPALGAGMRKVGAFFDTPPALVTAERGATPTGGPPTASTPGTSTGSGRGTLNPTDTNDVTGGSAAPGSVALPGMTSTAGAGRGSVNPPVASLSGDARPDLAGIPSLGGATGTAVAGAAGVRKFTTADGRTLYSNVAGGDNDKLMSGNPGVQVVPAIGGAGGAGASGASDVAGIYDRASKISADIARLNAEYRANGGDPGTLTTTPGMSVGSGQTILDDNRVAAAVGARPPSGLSARQLANYQTTREQTASQRAIADQNAAVQTAGQQSSAGASRYAVDTGARTAADRLALESSVHAQDAPLKASKVKEAQTLDAARGAYMNARTPEERAAAEETFRVLQGRPEKTVPELYSTTAIPAGVDPVTGMARGAGAIVTDRRTGATRIISSDEARGNAGAPAASGAITKQQYDALPKGSRYTGPDGKQYTKG
jgi:hypothetical protein